MHHQVFIRQSQTVDENNIKLDAMVTAMICLLMRDQRLHAAATYIVDQTTFDSNHYVSVYNACV